MNETAPGQVFKLTRLSACLRGGPAFVCDLAMPWSCTSSAVRPDDGVRRTWGGTRMRQVSGIVVLCIALACVMACGEGAGPSGSSLAGASLALDEGVWVLAVDRTMQAGSPVTAFQETPLPESAFAPVTGGPTYRLDVSEGGGRIVVVEPRLVGRRQEASSERLTYSLAEGTFAGGRIVVWRSSKDLQAELTIYGSGVPIIRSERGFLRKAR